MMRNIILLVVMLFLELYAQENKRVEYNFCTYVNGAKAIDIGKKVSIQKLNNKKVIVSEQHQGYDMYYYKVEYTNNVVSKVSILTLVTNKLLYEYFFDQKGFLKIFKSYRNNLVSYVCDVTYNYKKKKSIKKCSDGSKIISFYHDFNKEAYKILSYSNGKYKGKDIMNYNKGTLIRFNSKNKIVFKSDSISTYVDTCGALVEQK